MLRDNSVNELTDVLNASIALKQAIARLMSNGDHAATLHIVRRNAPDLVKRLEWFEAVAQPAVNEIAKETKRHA